MAGGALIGLLASFSMLGFFSEPVDFNTQIKPILNKNCMACHGGDHHLDAFTVFMAGGGVKRGITYGETDSIGYYAIGQVRSTVVRSPICCRHMA